MSYYIKWVKTSWKYSIYLFLQRGSGFGCTGGPKKHPSPCGRNYCDYRCGPVAGIMDTQHINIRKVMTYLFIDYINIKILVEFQRDPAVLNDSDGESISGSRS